MQVPRSLFLVPLLVVLGTSPASAYETPRGLGVDAGLSGFSEAEQTSLLAYRSVTHASRFQRRSREYLSAISYQLVDAKAADLFALFQEVDQTLPRALPATHRARYVGKWGELPLVEIVHGNGFINGAYTVIWQPAVERTEVTFWMAEDRPHDVDDIWGFFRITPVDAGRRSLVTVAVAVDLGKGGAQALYQSKIQQVILKSARYVRKFVDRRAKASR